MSVRSFCGPFQPALEDAFAERVRGLLAPGTSAAGRRLAIVTPSRRMADRLQRLLAAERGLCPLGVRFHTFHSLALEVLEDIPPDGELVPDALFHDTLVDRLLARRPGRRLSRGLAAAYRASIRDLVDCGLDPRAFREHFGERLQGSPDRVRLEEVLELQEAYLARLKEIGVTPPSGLARRATAALEDGESRALGRYAELLYYGFYDLTGAQADFFRAVGRDHPVTVFFPYRKGQPGWRFADRFHDLKLHTGGEPPVHLDARAESRALGPVLDSLSVPGKRAALPSPESLAVASVSGMYDEVWTAAKELLRLRDRGVAWEEMGVVARELEGYRSTVVEVFRENGIPFWLEAPDPLLRHPVAKLSLTLLRLRRREFPVRDVLDILESRYFRLARSASGGRCSAPRRPRGTWAPGGGGERLLGSWKRLVQRLGIRGGWSQWEGMLARWSREDLELFPGPEAEGAGIPKEDTARLLRWLTETNGRLRGTTSVPGGPYAPGTAGSGTAPAGWAAMAAHARRLLEDAFRVPAGDSGARAWAGTLAAVDSLAAFDRAWPAPRWEDFLDVLEERLRRAALEPPPLRRGVRVLGAMEARGESFRALVLLGLQEGVFPRQVREDPLLPDGVRRMLQEDAGYWLLPKRSGYDEERLLFHILLGSASERVLCVFQRSDDEGKALVPSLYLRELCQAAGLDLEAAAVRLPRQPIAKLEGLKAAGAARLSPKELSLLLASRGQGAAPLARLWAHAPIFQDHELLGGCLGAVRELDRAGEPGPMDGLVGPQKAFLRRLDSRGLSPTALQTFRQCPFRFLASRLLRMEEGEEPAELGDLTARTRGDLYHRILERFYAELSAGGFWSGPEGEDWLPVLERCASEALPPDGWRAMGVHPLLWRSIRDRMCSHLRRFLAKDIADIRASGLVPTHFEHPLSAEVEGLRLHGKLDRVDLDSRGTGFRVVDYKSTGGRRLEADVRAMRRIQPPIYLELMRAGSGLAPRTAEAHGAYFYALEESKETTGVEPFQPFTPEAWRELRGPLLENLREYRSMMAKGQFFIAPEDGPGGACGTCSFGRLCRKSHRASRRRAESSALRRRFEEFRLIRKGPAG